MHEDADLFARVDRLIAALQAHPDPTVREQVTALLEGIDAVHRSALTHLVEAIRTLAGDAFINRLIADPAIRLLLMSYDLVAVDRRIQAEEALDRVRGHLHARGIDIELQDVVGGVIYVRLHGLERSNVDPDAVRHDIEAALAEGLIGFQQLELGPRASVASGLVPIGTRRRPRRPVYRSAGSLDELPPGTLRAVEIDGLPVLLVNVNGDVYALRDACGDGPLPLRFSTLEGPLLRCSWHGCVYDVRSGRRADGGPDRVPIYPLSVTDDGEIRVAIDTVDGAGDDAGRRAAG